MVAPGCSVAVRGVDRRGRKRPGFTLVEAIATIAVLALVMTVASRIVFAAMDGYVDSVAGSRLASEMSAAMEVVASQFRDVPDTSDNPGEPEFTLVTLAAAQWGASGSIEVQDGALKVSVEGDAAGERVLLSGVTELRLQPLGGDGTPLALPLSGVSARQVRRMEIMLTAERAGLSRTIRTQVFIRSAMNQAP